MKRTKTLIGGILGTAAHIVFTGAMFFVLALILDIIFGLGGEMKEVPYLLIVACLLSILSIVFNFLTIFLFKTSKEAVFPPRLQDTTEAPTFILLLNLEL